MKFNFFKKKGEAKLEQIPETPKEQVKISVMYVYAWKEDVPLEERDTPEYPYRPFCKRMMELGRLYSRLDIEQLSARLGYSVFDRCGGDKKCRHYWKSEIIIKKTPKETKLNT